MVEVKMLQDTVFGRRRALGAIAATVVGGLAAPRVARAAVRMLRFGHNNTPDSQYGRGAIVFAEAVAADPTLSGTVKIQIFDRAQLGDDLSMLKAVQEGTIDGMMIGTSVQSSAVPELGIINAPYLFRDATQARAVLDGPLGQELKALSKAKGLPVLAWGENGLRHISSNVPVRTVADLKGLKLRVPQSKIMLDGFRAMGADAKPLSFGQLREALRTGEFQAQENAVVVVESNKLYEVQKYLCLTGHIYDGVGFLACADLMDDLSPPQQASLAACAQKGAVASRQVADNDTAQTIAQLRTQGMTVISDVDIPGFQKAARPFLESLGSTYGEARVQKLMAMNA